uniref:Response regulator n=1 Tax=Desulfatirhabdium butyrativorans TaxID=340467 RepID=A0A7C4VRP9_9BACT
MAKILVVDDSMLSRRMMRTILESDGHEVCEATDGMSGIERYFLEKPDLVTLDLTMEGLHGLDVLARIRQIDPKARVIVASADIQDATRALVMEAGAKAFVNKPFNPRQVLEAVRSALQGGAS